jgi:hypothetical protein
LAASAGYAVAREDESLLELLRRADLMMLDQKARSRGALGADSSRACQAVPPGGIDAALSYSAFTMGEC